MYKFNTKNIAWEYVIFVAGYQIFVLLSLPLYIIFTPPKMNMVIVTVVLILLTGISITAGYHRFYAHNSYTTNRAVELFFLFFATMSVQGSVLAWTNEHRLHHRFVDKEKDPYKTNKGILHAHMLWFFVKRPPIDPKVVPDLMKNKLLIIQNDFILPLAIGTNFLVFALVGWIFDDFIGALMFATLTRLFIVHHGTWCINSLAHYWGEKTFSKESSAVDNYIIALITFGEGYHNYHHVFTSDYRNGIRWYHYDPTKWLIWFMSKIGLANNLKKVHTHVTKMKLLEEDKKLLLKKIRQIKSLKKEILESKIHDISKRINTNLIGMRKLMQNYKFSKNFQSTNRLNSLEQKIRLQKKTIHTEWKNWSSLSKEVLNC